jgi:hypothetical protein
MVLVVGGLCLFGSGGQDVYHLQRCFCGKKALAGMCSTTGKLFLEGVRLQCRVYSTMESDHGRAVVLV